MWPGFEASLVNYLIEPGSPCLLKGWQATNKKQEEALYQAPQKADFNKVWREHVYKRIPTYLTGAE